jgi:prepilin-type processing-associated H-X9-DG protein
LIELLVVVAIIAMLIAMLLPSLNAARRTAQGAVCGARQKQCATALAMFANDHQSWIPPVWLQPEDSNGGKDKGITSYGGATPWGDFPLNGTTWQWAATLAKGNYLPGLDKHSNDGYRDYPMQGEVIVCPMAEPATSMLAQNAGANAYYAFGMRNHHPEAPNDHYRWWSARRNTGTRLITLDSPARSVVLIDSVHVWSSVDNIGRQCAMLTMGIAVPHLRHGRAANVAWADGSVRMTSADDLFDLEMPTATGNNAGVTHVVGYELQY